MIILDLDIDDVHGTVTIPASQQKVFAHGVEAALFACDDDIHDGLRLLPLFRRPLDASVSIQHLQKTVRGVNVYT